MSARPADATEPRDDHRFGASTPLSIGIEEELLLVDDRCRLVPAAEQVLAQLGPEHRGRASTEIFAAQIELKTGICLDAAQAAAELGELRRAVRASGLKILGSGLHPDDGGEAELIEKPRYDVVAEDLAGLLSTPPCGLHVHVGMPDPETAIRVANALRYHLPLVQALCANSPFREGADTGLASARSAVVASYPRFEVPRAFADYDEFLRVADQLIVAAGVADYTYLWWDVRPHPRLGTVEVRGMDVQADVATNVAVAALIQALAAKEIDRPSEPGLWREAIEESSFQANRHGLEARLMVDEKTAAPARQLGRQRLAEVGEYARQLGGAEALAEIERILDQGNGADVQRSAHADGGIPAVLEDLSRRTT